MTTDDDTLVRLLVAGDRQAVHRAVAGMPGAATAVRLLVEALVAPSGASEADTAMAGAAGLARTTRERQLVVIVAAHLAGDHHRVAALVRDHLVDHPDSLLAAWVASQQPDGWHPATARPIRTARTTPPPAPDPRRDHV